MNNHEVLPDKVIDKVIDIYLELEQYNSSEIIAIGTHLITLATRQQTDVELMELKIMHKQGYNVFEDALFMSSVRVSPVPFKDLPF